MATRKETAERKLRLRRDLRAARSEGAVRAGEMAVSQRVLAQRYRLSQFTISQELKKLTSEGVLHSVERVGTFVGARRGNDGSEFYLLITRDGSSGSMQFRQTQSGFEEAIALRGDAVVTLEKSEAIERCRRGAMPPVVGVFDLAYWAGEAPWRLDGQEIGARVIVAKSFERQPDSDLVSFDDIEGGLIAAQHLIGRGHQRIAFLGLHSPNQETGIVDWSAERESGWREVLQAEGLSAHDLAFHPIHDAIEMAEPDFQIDNLNAAKRRDVDATLARLVARPDITAVVAANDHIAIELLNALRNSPIASSSWPAIVGFDNHPASQGQLLTSLQLPFDELGRAAGNLLWERHNDLLESNPQMRTVAMRLIPRLTCHPDRARHANYRSLSPASGAIHNAQGELAPT